MEFTDTQTTSESTELIYEREGSAGSFSDGPDASDGQGFEGKGGGGKGKGKTKSKTETVKEKTTTQLAKAATKLRHILYASTYSPEYHPMIILGFLMLKPSPQT